MRLPPASGKWSQVRYLPRIILRLPRHQCLKYVFILPESNILRQLRTNDFEDAPCSFIISLRQSADEIGAIVLRPESYRRGQAVA